MKKVKLSFDWWDAVVEIDDSPKTLGLMQEQVLFWMGGPELIDDEGGNIEKAYLKMLAKEILFLSAEYNLYGVISEFENKEGWASLDGRHGVRLTSIDAWSFASNDISVEEI